MAKPVKTPEGTWRIQFMVQGIRCDGTFATKREADHYQAKRKAEVLAARQDGPGAVKTLGEALDTYAEKISPTKRGCNKELIRLLAFKRQVLPIKKPIGNVTTSDLVVWRDSRLAINARGSVLRDMTLLGTVFEVARREWQWIKTNPMKDVKRPGNPDHREVVIDFLTIRKMLRALRYGYPVRSVSCAVAHAFLLALSTGMRAGEIADLKWSDVLSDHVIVRISKTGKGRKVALSAVGIRILERMRGWDEESVFGLSPSTLSANFMKYRNMAGLEGFTFHDSRHTACTRIALIPGMTEMILCKLLGWKTTKQAMTYFNPSVKQMTERLAQKNLPTP